MVNKLCCTTSSDLSGVEPIETQNYQYGDSGWKDLLTSYNGEAITYDTIGNPLTYRGNTLSWTGGRELKSLSNANNNISYTYDADGVRATKTVNGVKSTYEYVGGQLVYEKRGNMDIYYWYDSYGNLSAIRYADGTVDNIYYVVCNSRGDVEAFYNGSGTVKSRYVYDSWGNVIKVVNANGVEITNQNDVAFINPIRYRGYYFDSETGLYYLKSRYYDPQVGRFINADGYASTGQGVLGNNMFAYCNNNPVMYSDPTGKSLTNSWIFAGATAGAVVAGNTAGAAVSVGFMGASIGSSACSSNVGAAPNYKNIGESNGNRQTNPNCYSYAIGLYDKSYNPGDFSQPFTSYDVDAVAIAVKSDMYNLGRGCRAINSYDSPINNNEYRIALRVSKPNIISTPVGNYLDWDYHFMVQTSSGNWAEKHGPGGGSVYHSSGNPSTISWDCGDIRGYYTSEIKYFAITN